MTPAEWISQLDEFLVEHGEDIILRKVVGTTSQTFTDVAARAHVTGLRLDELVDGITQDHEKVIVSPTEMTAAQWPSAGAPGIPVANSCKAVIRGKARNIDFVKPLIRGGLVRIELLVAG